MNFEASIDQANSLVFSLSISGLLLLFKTGLLIRDLFNAMKALKKLDEGRISEIESVMSQLKSGEQFNPKSLTGTISCNGDGTKWTGLVTGRLSTNKEQYTVDGTYGDITMKMMTVVKLKKAFLSEILIFTR